MPRARRLGLDELLLLLLLLLFLLLRERREADPELLPLLRGGAGRARRLVKCLGTGAPNGLLRTFSISALLTIEAMRLAIAAGKPGLDPFVAG